MPKEDDDIFETDRSHLTYSEWHAFGNGIYIGLVGWPEKKFHEAEEHYWRAGFLLGWFIKVVGILAIGDAVIN